MNDPKKISEAIMSTKVMSKKTFKLFDWSMALGVGAMVWLALEFGLPHLLR